MWRFSRILRRAKDKINMFRGKISMRRVTGYMIQFFQKLYPFEVEVRAAPGKGVGRY